ncbi:single-stranded DNA-binding protein [Bradymonas sediminis]|uniref:Single-stranded DNA-binding protein n=1 Tax=Bradymonas sediminis TaxID=1548548 RepID=A0A2Z4FPE4_9DELT|nr:single-stranded DNA-binding protein [Bradymonas sediminis]AWV90833.1 single-stranded DNA-binding protein [Bradymonas sediminis]TDP75431.1 single-strand binding protein [Bradymonas sediminis]
MSLNKAMIIGNLGADPEVRFTQSGTAVGNLRIATNEKWTDKSGQRQERTEWHRVVVFGKTAENCQKYLKKGRQIFVEGRIQTNEWQDKDGNKRYTTEIVASNVTFLSGGSGGGDYSDSGSSSGGGGYTQERPQVESNYDQSFNDDEIPF